MKYNILIMLFLLFIMTLSGLSAADVDNQAQITDNDVEIEDDISEYKIKSNDQLTTSNTIYQIDESNYDNYFDSDGVVNTDIVENNTQIILNDEFDEKSFIFEDITVNLTATDNSILKGSYIYIGGEGSIINKIKIDNKGYDMENTIVIDARNVVLENSYIEDSTTKKITTVDVLKDNTIIRNNTIITGGPSDEIDWTSTPTTAQCLSIAVYSSNNIICDNDIYTYSTVSNTEFGAIESITVQSTLNSIAVNNSIKNNRITVNTSDYAFGFNAGGMVDNNTVVTNNITCFGKNFADGVHIFSAVSNANISFNIIKCISDKYSDAIVISKDKMPGLTENNTIDSNNIEVVGKISNAIEVYNFNTSNILNNNASVMADNAYGIFLEGCFTNVTDNIIETDSSDKTFSAVLLNNAENNIVTHNNITTTGDYVLSTRKSMDNMIVHNRFYNNLQNRDVVNATDDNIYYNNTDPIRTMITLDSVSGEVYDNITLTAHITTIDGAIINNGNVVFKVNGISIKDENNQVIKVHVNNSIARLNHKIDAVWMKEESYISAVYSGTYDYDRADSAYYSMYVTKKLANISLSTDKKTVHMDEAITFIADITSDMDINDGYVIFKLNGKTIKYSNNTNRKAFIQDNIAQMTYYTYELTPKEYTLTCVFSSSIFERVEASYIFSVIKEDLVVVNSEVSSKSNHVYVSAHLSNKNGDNITSTNKIAIKINDKTVDNTSKCINGIINITIDVSLKIANHTVLVIVGENTYYNMLKFTTILEKVN